MEIKISIHSAVDEDTYVKVLLYKNQDEIFNCCTVLDNDATSSSSRLIELIERNVNSLLSQTGHKIHKDQHD